LKIVDSRPVMESSIIFDRKNTAACDLMIDTGSSIGLLLKTTDLTQFHHFFQEKLIGRGLNGPLYGYETRTERLRLGDFEMNSLQANIVESEWHNHASIGMEIMKNYIVVLNYCKSYACFKKIA
jgi:predicted aspartyl protease